MENLQKKPSKGILKSSSSFEQQNEYQTQPKPTDDKDIKWDEMNILQTLHPADKDYGHMKIDEPKTPYSYETTDGEHSDHETDTLDADTLAAKIAKKAMECPKVLRSASEESDSEDEDENLTEEEKKKKREFEVKRKMHYNEFQAVKLARKLLEEEGEDEDEEEADIQSAGQSSANKDSHQNGGKGETESSTNERIDFEDSDSPQNR